MTAYGAVVLAGGTSRRMGRDKLAERVGGVPLLARAVAACAGAEPVVVVGAPRPGLPVRVVSVLEDPPGGGPVPALAAGLAALPVHAPYAVVLAGDLPFVTAEDLRALITALLAAPDAAGALAVDGTGREQALLSAWRVPSLRARLTSAGPDLAGLGLHRTLAPLHRVRVELPPRPHPAWLDLDTPEDLAAARAAISTSSP